MNAQLSHILQQVQEGTLSPTQAEMLLQLYTPNPSPSSSNSSSNSSQTSSPNSSQTFESLGDFAKIDHQRSSRSGFPETIFCSGKSIPHLVEIYSSFSQKKLDVLGTRCNEQQYLAVKEVVPSVQWDALSSILKIHQSPLPQTGNIVLCTGGTSDIAVAEEAAQTAEFFGSTVTRVYDVGVAGIHRLLAHLPLLEKAYCIIAVAGMEGALPSVIAGLVSCPVIAVPTSVGYGAHFGGVAPLLTMLNSCAEGISVVNIDNGFGAGYTATQINRLATQGGTP